MSKSTQEAHEGSLPVPAPASSKSEISGAAEVGNTTAGEGEEGADSDSDSDVEYVPEGSDGSCDEYENLSDGEDVGGGKRVAGKRKRRGAKKTGKLAVPKLEADVKDLAGRATSTRYVTRSSANDPNAERHTILKDEDGDEEKKKRIDDLWASFKQTPATTSTTKRKPEASEATAAGGELEPKRPKRASDVELPVKKVTTVEVKETFDFAGEAVTVTKMVPAASKEGARVLSKAGGGGKKKDSLDDIISGLGGRKSMNVVAKSGHDWNEFKKTNNIDSLELRRENMDGYIERQNFMARTEVRQWERQTAERKRLSGKP